MYNAGDDEPKPLRTSTNSIRDGNGYRDPKPDGFLSYYRTRTWANLLASMLLMNKNSYSGFVRTV
jgi:hypothetical protein